MSPFIIDQDTSLITCLDQAVTTRALLAATPLTAPLAAGFDAWIDEWKITFMQEIDHRIATTSAAAVEVSVDVDLNDLSDETSRTVLIFTRNSRTDPEYVFYFKGERASDFKKPHLGDQLDGMKAWLLHMAASPHSPIVDLGKRISIKVTAADAAIANTAAVDQASREFRLTGARKQLIDKLNALRKSTYGTLSEMPHKHPALKLPGSFADRFFRAERPSAPSRPPTADSLKIEMDALKLELERVTAAYNDALAAESSVETKKLEDETLRKELDVALAELERQGAHVAALKAKLAK